MSLHEILTEFLIPSLSKIVLSYYVNEKFKKIMFELEDQTENLRDWEFGIYEYRTYKKMIWGIHFFKRANFWDYSDYYDYNIETVRCELLKRIKKRKDFWRREYIMEKNAELMELHQKFPSNIAIINKLNKQIELLIDSQ